MEGQKNPLLVRVDVKSGHGAGKPTTKSIEEYTDIFCFLVCSYPTLMVPCVKPLPPQVKSLGLQYRK